VELLSVNLYFVSLSPILNANCCCFPVRLENEHIGNADQFRVTREVPLPYVFTGDKDSDDEDHGTERPARRLSVRLPVMSKDSSDTDVEAEGR
jgi:hypothetical protein